MQSREKNVLTQLHLFGRCFMRGLRVKASGSDNSSLFIVISCLVPTRRVGDVRYDDLPGSFLRPIEPVRLARPSDWGIQSICNDGVADKGFCMCDVDYE